MRAVERAAAERLKAENNARYSALRTRHDAAYQRRQDEIRQSRDDRQAGRAAIYEKYAHTLDAIWNPKNGPKEAAPDRSAWQKFMRQSRARENVFEAREKTVMGRLQNAGILASRKAGLFRVIRLALNQQERRALFDHEQRRFKAQNAPPREAGPKGRPQPATPNPRHVRAAEVKAMRAAELAAYDRQQAAAAKSMEGRHQFQRERETGEKDTFRRESKAAWEAHRTAFPPPSKAAGPQQEQPAPGNERTKTPDSERPADRFGRSRDRKPRQPRQGRASAKAAAEAEFSPVEGVQPSEASSGPQTPEATHGANPGQREASAQRVWTPEERAAKIEATRKAREERDRGHEADLGRTMD